MKEQSVTLHLPPSVVNWVNQVRGATDSSTYILHLLEEQMQHAARERIEREKWLAELRAQYTPEVCEQTLKINDEYPIHEE